MKTSNWRYYEDEEMDDIDMQTEEVWDQVVKIWIILYRIN